MIAALLRRGGAKRAAALQEQLRSASHFALDLTAVFSYSGHEFWAG